MRRWLLLVAVLALVVPSPVRSAETASSAVASVSDASDNEDAAVAVPQPSALALSYYRSGNWLWVLNHVWAIGVLALLLITGASGRIRDVARHVGRSWFFTIGIYVVLFLTIDFVIDLPLAYYEGFVRLHAYGLSNQSLAKWFGDSCKRLAVSAIVGFLFTWVPYLLIARRAASWWLITTLLVIPFLFGVMLLKPIWVDPLFNTFGPMKDKALEREIVALAKRGGIGESRIYEVDKVVDTNAVNAYVTGVFGTKRIVLWDTLIAKLNHEQVLAVVGHEMGHYVLGHVPRSIVLSSVITLACLFWVDRAGRWLIARYGRRFRFDRLSDIASVPLILLLMQVATLALAPVANAYSQYQEREADRFALDITHRNRSAALAFVAIQRENLSNPRPGLFYRVWRSTHPSIGERIDFCNAYHPWRDGRPLGAGETAP